jgi:hypothetical protein
MIIASWPTAVAVFDLHCPSPADGQEFEEEMERRRWGEGEHTIMMLAKGVIPWEGGRGRVDIWLVTVALV